MRNFNINALTSKGGMSLRHGDTVKLTDETITKIIGQTGDIVQHTGGFCTSDKIVERVMRPAYITAKMTINSIHVTAHKPDGVYFNIKIPVLLTGNTSHITGNSFGGRHYEVVLPGGDVHWISSHALILG